MNAQSQILEPSLQNPSAANIQPSPAPMRGSASADAPCAGSTPEDRAPGGCPLGRRRRTGKIASLPNPIREHINRMLQDGVPYRVIIEKLHDPGAPALPYEISEHNISEWKDGGYQDWLKDQFWQEEMRDRQQAFSGLLANGDAIQLPEGGLQLAAIGLCELLRDLSELGDGQKKDPDQCVRLSHALARVSRSILQLQQYRGACTRARAALVPLKDPTRKPTEKETLAIVRRIDEILGFCSPEDDEEEEKSAKTRVPNSEQNGRPSIAN